LETIIDILLQYREDSNHPIIIILDCCRSQIKPDAPRRSDGDPLRGTSGQLGQGANIAILYSTAEGEVAMDESGEGDHSPYTKVFLESLVKGLALSEINNTVTSCLANSGRFSGIQVSHLSFISGHLSTLSPITEATSRFRRLPGCTNLSSNPTDSVLRHRQ